MCILSSPALVPHLSFPARASCQLLRSSVFLVSSVASSKGDCALVDISVGGGCRALPSCINRAKEPIWAEGLTCLASFRVITVSLFPLLLKYYPKVMRPNVWTCPGFGTVAYYALNCPPSSQQAMSFGNIILSATFPFLHYRQV